MSNMIDAFDAMDSLLDKSIDDIADLPEFKVPHTGMYNLLATTSAKEINDKPAIEALFEVVGTIELADAANVSEEQISKPGDKFSIAFFLEDNDGNDSELGFGRLKEFVAPFGLAFGEKNLKTLLKEKIQQTAIVAKVVRKQRRAKKGESKDTVDGVFDARVSEITIS